MSDIDDEVRERREKRERDNFTYDDLHDYVKERCEPGAKVHVLKKGRWVKVNEYQLFLRDQSWNFDDAWIYVVVRPDKPFLNWFQLPLARIKAKQNEVVVGWWSDLPDTNLMLDIWFVGDGTGGVPIVVERKK